MAQNTLRGVVELDGKRFRKKIRVYKADITRTAGANASFQGFISINPTTLPFMLQKLHGNDTTDGAALTSQLDMFIGLVDNESGYNWTDGTVPRASILGDRIFGYTLPEELPIRGNTRIQINVQNPAVAPAAGTMTVSLVGYELWPL